MKVLSLFSGGGLGDYALELAGMEIVGQVEIDKYCQKILKLRWPKVPKWTDIKNVRGKEILEKCGTIDLISGGFPCQPHSFAGKRKGAMDDRNLWPEMLRVISEIRPAWVLAENVLGVLGFAESVVLPDLESKSYETLTIVFPSHALGTPHRRDRVWIMAHGGYDGRSPEFEQQQKKRPEIFDSSSAENVADSESSKQKRIGAKSCKKQNGFTNGSKNVSDSRGPISNWLPKITRKQSEKVQNRCERNFGSFWSVEPSVGRVAHGIADRVDRLKLLGNGQVVQVVEFIGKQIMEFERL